GISCPARSATWSTVMPGSNSVSTPLTFAMGIRRDLCVSSKRTGSEPGLVPHDIVAVELCVRLDQVDDEFDEGDDADDEGNDAEGDPADRTAQQHQNPGRRLAEVEFVDADPAEEEGQKGGDDLVLV